MVGINETCISFYLHYGLMQVWIWSAVHSFFFLISKCITNCETNLSEWMRGARVLLLVVHQKSKWREKALSKDFDNNMMTTTMIIKAYSLLLPSLGFLMSDSDNNMLGWCMLTSISTGNSCTTTTASFFFFYIYPPSASHKLIEGIWNAPLKKCNAKYKL